MKYPETEDYCMTSLLQQAFQQAQALSEDEQNAIAAILLEEIASEGRWQESFARSAPVLDRLAAEAREEYRQGRTVDLSDLL
jgi:hypothetical protein